MPEIDEPVHVVEYSASWPAEFAAERARLASALNLPPEDIEHIGSTAVPGLAGKPIIDLMLGLAELPPSEVLVQRVGTLGYLGLGEAGVPGRWYFRRRGPTSANLHLVAKGHSHWVRNLALRDYLRGSVLAQERYARAKRSALAAGANTLLAYSAAKSAVLISLLQEALAHQNAG
jgi:GrpB-like predicted nucleotidyltransferase (UPF0157 family)